MSDAAKCIRPKPEAIAARLLQYYERDKLLWEHFVK